MNYGRFVEFRRVSVLFVTHESVVPGCWFVNSEVHYYITVGEFRSWLGRLVCHTCVAFLDKNVGEG